MTLAPAVLVVLASFLSLLPLAECHAVLKSPKARDGMAVGIGIKYIGNITQSMPDPGFPACDIFPPGPTVATFKAGSSVKVDWEITIPHPNPPGVFINIQYQPNEPFIDLATGLDNTLQSFTVQLPAGRTSNNAVLRWLWGSDSDGGFYLGCSDIVVEGAAPAPAPAPKAQPAAPPVAQPAPVPVAQPPPVAQPAQPPVITAPKAIEVVNNQPAVVKPAEKPPAAVPPPSAPKPAVPANPVNVPAVTKAPTVMKPQTTKKKTRTKTKTTSAVVPSPKPTYGNPKVTPAPAKEPVMVTPSPTVQSPVVVSPSTPVASPVMNSSSPPMAYPVIASPSPQAANEKKTSKVIAQPAATPKHTVDIAPPGYNFPGVVPEVPKAPAVPPMVDYVPAAAPVIDKAPVAEVPVAQTPSTVQQPAPAPYQPAAPAPYQPGAPAVPVAPAAYPSPVKNEAAPVAQTMSNYGGNYGASQVTTAANWNNAATVASKAAYETSAAAAAAAAAEPTSSKAAVRTQPDIVV
ncbi:hypothetical protein HDU96_006509, partial [Phlyctochytrium bullatum]